MKKNEIVSNVNEFIEKSLQHKGEYIVEVMGRPIRIHPQVLSPRYSYSSRFIIENWDVGADMTVLDVGTGSGILALFAALQGAKRVVALDINIHACAIAEKNMRENRVFRKVTVVHSDLYTGLPKERFDRVVFNAPYWNKKTDPALPLTYGVYDEDYSVLNRFLKESGEYLALGGKILLGFSSQGDVARVRQMINSAGWNIEKEIREKKGHTRILFYLKDNGT